LFVEPARIGRGTGRSLYAYVLRTAREAGFARLVIEADPHAEPFYRALGARPLGARPLGARPPDRHPPGPARGLPWLAVDLTPPAPWVRAWTGGRRAVHLGNVAGFQGMFAALTPAERQESAHYSCMAAFATPHPAALVLPLPVPPDWLGLVARPLAWDRVEVFDGVADPVRAVRDRPALRAHLRELGAPLVPWGHTPETAELTGTALPAEAHAYESKREAHQLFDRLAAQHPGIAVPAQWTAGTRRRAAWRLAVRARAGAGTVVKTEYGAGGSGVRVLPARARARQRRALLRSLPPGPLLLEEYVTGGAAPRDVTYDGFVDRDGRVHEVGAAAMEVADTVYAGAAVGPGAVPAARAETVCAFGRAVGGELAARGYRGWFDVDFVAARGGALAPTEVNLRLTGPSAAFMVKARLDDVRGGDHLVRAVDRVPLGARLPEPLLGPFLRTVADRCAAAGAVLVPSLPTAAFAPDPWIGVLVAAPTPCALDAGTAAVRDACRGLGRMF
ncbi:GNAT family N-acetyltransferase, partial [Streptomyces boncukensis]|uniref:GNAT family N-acetyltransferase n=1 Tax=Streptomyces boncukensis TaxID=2711219 RepID=UPI0019D2218F